MSVTVLETGPATVRRLCDPDERGGVDAATAQTALDTLDDRLALVDAQPVCVDALWRTVMQSLCHRGGGHTPGPVIIVHPSWWSQSRTGRVSAAARATAGEVVMRHRSRLLATAAPEPSVVVEITPRLVVITAGAVAAEPRTGQLGDVAAAVARRVAAMTAGPPGTVVIDAPGPVGGATALAAMIGDRLRHPDLDLTVEVVDDARLQRLAAAAWRTREQPATPPAAGAGRRRRDRMRKRFPVAAVVSAALLCGVGTCDRQHVPTPDEAATTFLVEGRVTLEVPARWPVQRVTAGPGSARVVLASPSNDHVALHVTQSLVPDETLSATADVLAQAISAEPGGVFVDFDPAAHRAGRPAVTYRERRDGHDIEWTILLAGDVRISIGCQSPPGRHDVVRQDCDRAVRSARRLG